MTALLNIIDENKDKELVANGLACVNLAFSHDIVVSRTIKDLP
jgi:hypothetical protein